jgi:hypothetical protein
MELFSICKNPRCRFVLDRRVLVEMQENPQSLSNCPVCGGAWSSSCPFCGRALTINFVSGLPHSACCGQRLRVKAKAA